MPDKDYYVTVVNGLGERAQIPRAGLEQYKKQMAEFMEIAKTTGSPESTLKAFEIVAIED